MWGYCNPVRIHFGDGCFDRVARLISGRGYAVVTYDEPYFDSLVGHLAESAGAASMYVNNITPNPDFRMLSASCAQLTSASELPEVIVAIGGGSVLDAAKVLALGCNGFDAVRAHLESKGVQESLPSRAIPLIVVPTTAGTGSEVTSWATVWDTDAKAKHSLSRDDLYPTDAVVDPSLMHALPREQTISTGLDALSHALESLWNVNANPISTNFAVAAAREVLECLAPLAEDLGNAALRRRMARAATMAGLAFSNTRTALAHSLSYPITLHHGVPHGIACSFTLPGVMQSCIGSDEACDDALRRIFGNDLDAGVLKLMNFLNELGVATDYAEYGVVDADWRSWIDSAIDGERGQNFIGSRGRVREVFAVDGGSSLGPFIR